MIGREDIAVETVGRGAYCRVSATYGDETVMIETTDLEGMDRQACDLLRRIVSAKNEVRTFTLYGNDLKRLVALHETAMAHEHAECDRLGIERSSSLAGGISFDLDADGFITAHAAGQDPVSL